MSYARFLTTDIYAFADTRGGYTCMCCSLALPRQGKWIWESEDDPDHDMPNDFHCDRLVELHTHILQHVAAADNVGNAVEYIEEELSAGSPYDT